MSHQVFPEHAEDCPVCGAAPLYFKDDYASTFRLCCQECKLLIQWETPSLSTFITLIQDFNA